MSEIQEIEVIIAPDGSVKLEVSGVKGQKCVDVTKDLESILGGAILERKFTPEYEEKQDDEQRDFLNQGV